VTLKGVKFFWLISLITRVRFDQEWPNLAW